MAWLGSRALGGWPVVVVVVVLAAAGCGGGSAGGGTSPDGGGQAGGRDGSTSATDGGDARPSTDGNATTDAGGSGILALPGCAVANAGTCVKPMERTRADVCGRYVADRIDRTVNVFTATTGTCVAGTTTAAAIDATLHRINFYRWLVGVAPVTLNTTANSVATACALITARRPEFKTNQPIDLHHPPATTPCYTAAGADAALTSLVGPAVDHPTDGIDSMMYDFGDPNRGIIGHRRILTDPTFSDVGLGFSRDPANGFGAMCAKATWGDFAPQTALDGMLMYPAPDVFPWDALTYSTVGEVMSWTFVLPAVLGLGDAQVSMFVETSAGRQPVEITSGPAGGDLTEATLWITPKVSPPRDATIVVEIANIPVGPVGYRVVLADCGTIPLEPQKTRQGGPCGIVYQDCVTPGYSCYQVPGGDMFDGQCLRSGSFPAGAPCWHDEACVAGTGCVAGVCSTFCDFGSGALHPCAAACGTKGYTPLWSVDDLNGQPFGDAICKN